MALEGTAAATLWFFSSSVQRSRSRGTNRGSLFLTAVAIYAFGSEIGHPTRRVGLDLEPMPAMQSTPPRTKTPSRKREARSNDDHHGEDGTNHLRLFHKHLK